MKYKHQLPHPASEEDEQMKDVLIYWRGSASDLATDLKPLLSPEQQRELGNLLLNNGHSFTPAEWHPVACKFCNLRREQHT